MSSKLPTTNDLLDRLKERYEEKRREREEFCRHLAALTAVAIPPDTDAFELLDDCKEMAAVRHDDQSQHLISKINDDTLDMRKLQELIRASESC